jgi:chorismate mutase
MSTFDSTGDHSVRALRGATTVEADDPDAIITATSELLEAMLEKNGVARDDLISMIFTATPDLSAAFPAVAARRLGLAEVPLLCSVEIAVPDSIERCIRILVHLYTPRPAAELRHVYLGRAKGLRSDLNLDL